MEELDGYLEQDALIDQLFVDRAAIDKRIEEAKEAKFKHERDFIHSNGAAGLSKTFVYQHGSQAYLVTGSHGRISVSRSISVERVQYISPEITNPA